MKKAIDRAFSLVRKPNTANSCGYFVSPIFYFFFNSASCYCGSCLESGFLDTKQPPRWTNTVEGNSLTSRSPPKKNHRACDDCREVGRQDLIDAQGADTWLVGGWTNPSEKYARQIGNLPQKRGKNKIIWNHHLANHWFPLKKGPNPNLWGWYLREGWLKRMLWHLKNSSNREEKTSRPIRHTSWGWVVWKSRFSGVQIFVSKGLKIWNLSPLTTKNRPRGWNLTPLEGLAHLYIK